MPKTELILSSPFMNAAGTLGFSPDRRSPIDISQFGAFVTNPVSWAPRTPAKGERFIPFPGGFLLHTGYPNPGLGTVIRKHARAWARTPVPVIVHLLAQDASTLGRMVQRLEGVDGVIGVEIGLPPEIDHDLAHEMILASLGELAVIVRLPFEHAQGINHHAYLLDAITRSGASAISLAPPRGSLMGTDGLLTSGRLYGPCLFPQVLSTVLRLLEFNLPVIAAGGIYTKKDVDALLAAGVIAVQLDGCLWRGTPALSLHERST